MPEGTLFAVLTYRISRHTAWEINLYRKTETPYRAGTQHGRDHLGSDYADTLWGAKHAAWKLYRRYLKRRKLGDGHTITMVMGKD